MVFGELFQHIRRRGITCLRLLSSRKLHGVKENLSQLLRGIDVKILARLPVDGGLQLLNPGHQGIPVGFQLLPPDFHALPLHVIQNQGQRHLYPAHKLFHACPAQFLPQNLGSPQGHPGPVAAVLRKFFRSGQRGLPERMPLYLPKTLLPAGDRNPQVL